MDIHFEVISELGRTIRISEGYWHVITTVKHQILEGEEKEVKRVLTDPIEIRRSKTDPDVYLYYAHYKDCYLCVVARHFNGDGFVITAYPTDRIKRGDLVWKK